MALAHLLVLQLILPEELLHHEGHALHAGHGVALVVEIQQVPGLATQRKEEADTLGTPGENIQILIKQFILQTLDQIIFKRIQYEYKALTLTRY